MNPFRVQGGGPERGAEALNAAMHAFRGEVSDLRRRLLQEQDRRAAAILSRHREAAAASAPQPSEVPTDSGELDAARAELAARAERIEELAELARRQQSELDTMTLSPAWRLTRPARVLARLVRTGRLRAKSG